MNYLNKRVLNPDATLDMLLFHDDYAFSVTADVKMGVAEYDEDNYYDHNIEVMQMQFCSDDWGCWDYDKIYDMDKADERRKQLMRIYYALENQLIEHVDYHIREYIYDDFEDYYTIDYDTDVWYS